MGFKFGQKIIDILRFKWFLRYLRRERLKYMNWFKKTQLTNPQLGQYSYIGDNSVIADPETSIGKFCSIAGYVNIGTTFHPKNFLSTHPFQYLVLDNGEISNKGFVVHIPHDNLAKFKYSQPCIIGNDVWIGVYSVIMDGVTIGDGAIIGANSTITKDVPPYAIVVGSNRIIGYRFSPEIIKQLLELKWWDLDEKYLYDLPFNDINECIKKLKAIRESLK